MGRKSFSYCFFFSCRFPVGTSAEPKRWGWGGGREGGGVNQVFPCLASPHLSPAPESLPSSSSAPAHRCPCREDTVNHIASESHTDHQIGGIAGGAGGTYMVGVGSREPQALITRPGPPSSQHGHPHPQQRAQSPPRQGCVFPQSPTPRGRGSQESTPHRQGWGWAASPFSSTYPTPIR